MKWKTYLGMAYAVLLLGAVIMLTNLNNFWFYIGAGSIFVSIGAFLKSVRGFNEARLVEWSEIIKEREK